jgi:hypothetical protein
MDQDWVSQLPLVGAFVFFCLTLIKLFLDFLKVRDEAWQTILNELRDADRQALALLTEEIKQIGIEFRAHDYTMRGVLELLQERKVKAGARAEPGGKNGAKPKND